MAAGDNVHLVGVAVATEDSELLANDIRWMRRSDVRKHLGVGKDILDSWVGEGKVEAHKLNPSSNGTVIFSVRDIEKTIQDSPRYMPEKFSEIAIASNKCFC